MNYLLIILAIVFFFKNFGGGKNGLFGNLSYTDISPLLNLISECGLFNNFPLSSVENLLNGNFNFSELLPVILSFFNGFSSENTPNSTDCFTDINTSYSSNESGTQPIVDLFNNEFKNAIENYFKN